MDIFCDNLDNYDTAIFRKDGKTIAFIDCIFVNEDFRGYGMGRWLFKSLPGLLKQKLNINVVSVKVMKMNNIRPFMSNEFN